MMNCIKWSGNSVTRKQPLVAYYMTHSMDVFSKIWEFILDGFVKGTENSSRNLWNKYLKLKYLAA